MKRLTALFLTLLLLLSLSACGNSAQNPSGSAGNNNSQGEDPSEAENPEDAEAGFPFTLTTKDGAEVTFTHVPETVLCTNVNTGDQLMALGLGDKIIATANNNTQVAPEFREEYEAIPEMADRPTLETILDMEPDFVYGRSSAFSEKYNTEHDTLSQYGIMSLSSIEGYKLGADLEDVYQDFYNLGRIFRVEDKAEEIVSAMKEQVAAVEEAVAGQESTKVFVFDMAQEEGAYTCGNNFTSKLIEHAGGTNIFNDLDTTWATVSWEEVVERAPEVIVIDDYGDTSLEEKIAFLKENPALATIPAVQNDRIISVTLCESFASSMTGDTVEKFARAFHPDCFE
ncbi:ABC transporter substrate-binding protein [Pseudoflavonifractor capillosus]|uniref:ABC transporter substrate-binding protein n=1 Tax=Pseudoflavonifractor capillosus TaxID=106588 RepID=A0A921MKW8_9FIRM|nr:ABC transporter substrate-binding protein [Pseudoflavonifractor capillosus]HJG86448.1 ABC transporter substrate-binding protein [Pseudoflavonifractor capillosus]